MRESPYLSVIVPAYNEVRSIAGTLDAIHAYLDKQPYSYEIIVSADGNDGTRELVATRAAQDSRLTVIGSPERGGKGRGVRAGVALARGQIIGFVDADYKTPIEELEKLLPWFDQGYDMVIGSRAMAESRIDVAQPLFRRIGSRAFALVLRIMIGLWHVSDTQCGFKFFRRQAAYAIFSRQRIDGYMFDVEILRLAERLHLRVKEVGIIWRDDGDSRYDPFIGTLLNAREIIKIRFSRMPEPIDLADSRLATSHSAEREGS